MTGRPQKNKADYFKHYVRNGRTKMILFNRFGHVGRSVWWELLEVLSGAENHYYDARKTANWEALCAVLGVETEVAEQIFNLLSEIEKIDDELWQERIIWCKNLVSNLDEMYAARKRGGPGKPSLNPKTGKIEVSQRKKGVSIEESGVFSPETTHSKAEYSTAKDSKQNAHFSPKKVAGKNGTHEPDAEGEKAAVAAGAAAAFLKDDSETAKTELIAEGVSPSVAKRLAESYPLQYILDHIDIVAAKVAKGGVRKPVAYLVKAIEENYEPPKDHITREERKRREIEKAKREKKKQIEQEAAKKKLKAEQAKYDELQKRFEALPEEEQDRLHTHALKELEGNDLLWAAYQRNKEAGESDPLNMPTVRLSYLDAIAAEIEEGAPF